MLDFYKEFYVRSRGPKIFQLRSFWKLVCFEALRLFYIGKTKNLLILATNDIKLTKALSIFPQNHIGLLLLTNHEGARTREMLRNLPSSIKVTILSHSINRHYFDFDVWLLKKIFNCSIAISSNEDLKDNKSITKSLRDAGFTTINVMHGKIYEEDFCYDYFVAVNQSTSHELQKRFSKSPAKFLVYNNYQFDTEFAPKSVKKFLFYDQPSSPWFSEENRRAALESLKKIENTLCLTCVIKPHPKFGHSKDSRYFKEFYRNEFEAFEFRSNPDHYANEYIFASTVRSNAGLEAISSGLPTLYLNFCNVLDSYFHLKFLKEFSVKNETELERLLNEGKRNPLAFWKSFYLQQQSAFREEYLSEKDAYLLKSLFNQPNF